MQVYASVNKRFFTDVKYIMLVDPSYLFFHSL